MKKKLAVFFPGVGYNCDKPLLYYTKKVAKEHGFQTLNISYGEFPKVDIRKNLELIFSQALEAAKRQLEKVDFSEYETVLFVSKSVGTAVSATCQKDLIKDRGTRFCNVYMTPVTASLKMLTGEGIIFSGTGDDWVQEGEVERWCDEHNYPLHSIEDANHSMETGDTIRDLGILKNCMSIFSSYLETITKKG